MGARHPVQGHVDGVDGPGLARQLPQQGLGDGGVEVADEDGRVGVAVGGGGGQQGHAQAGGDAAAGGHDRSACVCAWEGKGGTATQVTGGGGWGAAKDGRRPWGSLTGARAPPLPARMRVACSRSLSFRNGASRALGGKSE